MNTFSKLFAPVNRGEQRAYELMGDERFGEEFHCTSKVLVAINKGHRELNKAGEFRGFIL